MLKSSISKKAVVAGRAENGTTLAASVSAELATLSRAASR